MLTLEEYITATNRMRQLDLHFEWDGVHVNLWKLAYYANLGDCVRHQHSSYEFHLTSKGQGTVRIGSQSYFVSPRSVYVTGPGVVHAQVSSPTDPWSEIGIGIILDDTTAAKGEAAQVIQLLQLPRASVPTQSETCFSLTDRIFREVLQPHIGYLSMIKQHLVALLIEIARATSPDAPIPVLDNHEQDRMDLIRRFVEDNYHHRISIHDISQWLYLSVRQLDRIIYQRTGMSFRGYLEQQRIRQAQIRLRTTELTITEIAEQTGFSSAVYFHEVFKKATGFSPTAFRNRNKT